MDDHLRHVVLDSQSGMGASETDGPTHYEDVSLLVVSDDDLHVWVDGTHYIGDGIADAVAEGDVFYRATPEVAVFRVTAINEDANSDDLGVEIEYLYDSMDTATDSGTDQVSLNALTGQQAKVAMGDSGPPVVLKQT